ncbi:uncharacterized protein LOC143862424 isoform X2 [Tasmannia lanceolata]|uniref:uncharacterized protein LOC143862424 isoform X2 n=1 Tax=Tasmannia lanceolata TaxID=3420 RepID=UPI0040643E9B
MAENQENPPLATVVETLDLVLQQLQEIKDENQAIKAQLAEKIGPSPSSSKGKEPMHHTTTSAAPAQPTFVPIPDKTEEELEKEQYNEDHSKPSQSTVDKTVMEKLERLTRKVQDIQLHDQGGFNPSDLTLFPEIRLPASFQMPDFDKYDGVGCPITHLQMFTIMCQPQGLSAEQMAQLFPVSLTKVARRWFMVLDKTRYRTWKDIGEQFIKQFKYDDGTEITRKDLERTKQDSKESFLTFVKRWRRLAAQMMQCPSEEEQIQMIMKNISSQLQYHMSLQYYPDFKYFINAGMQIEEAMAQGVYNRGIAAQQKPNREFTPLLFPPSVILQQGLESGDIYLPRIKEPHNPLLRTWRAEEHCDFHRGSGHSTDQCITLRHVIQKLIDERKLPFQQVLNIVDNPMHNHVVPPLDDV